MEDVKLFMDHKYADLDPIVDLEHDFFTGFVPARRAEITAEEAKFYHSITEPYSVDGLLNKYYISCPAKDGYFISVKVYEPKEKKPGAGAYVFYHGGGFTTCTVETHDFVPGYLAAKTGYVAFSVEYRLGPEYKYPTNLEDCYDATKWIVEHAARFGFDPMRLCVSGDSAGGNLAAAVTLLARERKEFSIAKQVLIYGVFDSTGEVKTKSDRVFEFSGLKRAADAGPKPARLSPHLNSAYEVYNPLVSPLLAKDHTGLPEALFIEGDCDPLTDGGLRYAQKLHEAGVPVEAEVYDGMPHAFILRTYPQTFAAFDRIIAFLNK